MKYITIHYTIKVHLHYTKEGLHHNAEFNVSVTTIINKQNLNFKLYGQVD
jgi:hypothetical protein